MFEERLATLRYDRPGLEGLYEPVLYGIGSGGKRLRPVLALMCCEACGGDVSQALSAACGLEMFHNFTLLHDDVMDNSDMRRGRETVHKRWDVNTAILSGDTMLTLATELVADVPDAILRRVLSTFDRMAIEVYEGQRLDMDFETRQDVTVDEYIEMITLKTGALLGASARIGGLVAGCDDVTADCLERYGRCLGVAFQIQDDYLDVFGDSAVFGKPIGGDIINDKKTFLLLEALGRNGADREALNDALRLKGDVKVTTVRRIYERLGVDTVCRKAILHWTGDALRALKKSKISSEGAESLKKLADKLTGRTR